MGHELSPEDARELAREQARDRVDKMPAGQRAAYTAQFHRAEERARQIMAHGTPGFRAN